MKDGNSPMIESSNLRIVKYEKRREITNAKQKLTTEKIKHTDKKKHKMSKEAKTNSK